MKKPLFILAISIGCFRGWAEPKEIEVSYDNVVMVVFGDKTERNYVSNVSVGNPEAVSFSYKDNKVLLQALEEHFIPTNMIIELAGGALYIYKLVYNNTPASFLIKEETMGKEKMDKEKDRKVTFAGDAKIALEQSKEKTSNKSTTDEIGKTNLVKEKKDYLYGVGEIKNRMKVWLGGIWTDNFRYYYLKISMLNSSNVNCNIGGVSVYVEEKKKLKRSVNVRKELRQHVHHDALVVGGKEQLTFVVVIDLITINKGKKLMIDIWEDAPGERRFLLDVESKSILDAHVI